MTRGPSVEELAIWETVCWAAMSHAQQVRAWPKRLPSADPLLKARKACRNTTLPIGQQMQGAPIVRLLRLIDQWAALGPDDRRLKADDLYDLAAEAARLAGFME